MNEAPSKTSEASLRSPQYAVISDEAHHHWTSRPIGKHGEIQKCPYLSNRNRYPISTIRTGVQFILLNNKTYDSNMQMRHNRKSAITHEPHNLW